MIASFFLIHNSSRHIPLIHSLLQEIFFPLWKIIRSQPVGITCFVLALILPPLSLPATEILVEDIPDDAGEALSVSWELPPDIDQVAAYRIYRMDEGDDEFHLVGKVGDPKGTRFVDHDPRYPLEPGVSVTYRIVAADEGGTELESIGESPPFAPRAQWFKSGKLNSLIATLFVLVALVATLRIAKRGKGLFIRMITGLEALDEAVGRATELGRPILYVPGLSSMADIATVASINILGPVAKKAAEYDTRIIVPNRYPIVYTITHEVVKEAYLSRDPSCSWESSARCSTSSSPSGTEDSWDPRRRWGYGSS